MPKAVVSMRHYTKLTIKQVIKNNLRYRLLLNLYMAKYINNKLFVSQPNS